MITKERWHTGTERKQIAALCLIEVFSSRGAFDLSFVMSSDGSRTGSTPFLLDSISPSPNNCFQFNVLGPDWLYGGLQLPAFVFL